MTLEQVKNLENPKICIIRLGAFGDIVRTIRVLEIIKRNYPDSQLYWVCESRHANILENHKFLKEIIKLPRKKWVKELKTIYKIPKVIKEFSAFKQKLKSYKFDLVLDFHGILKSGIISKMTEAKVRIGFSKKYSKEFNHRFNNVLVDAPGTTITRVEKNLSLLRPLVNDIDTSEEIESNIFISIEDKKYINSFLENFDIKNKLVIGINCATSDYGSHKQWPPDYFVKLIQKIFLEHKNIFIVLTWGPGEFFKIRKIKNEFDRKDIVIGPETTMKQAAYLYTKFNLFITGDTGPMHLAAAMNTKVLGIFGPSDPLINAPWGKKHRVAWHDVECNPCRNRKCKILKCQTELTPDKVYNIFQKIIGQNY